MSIGRGYTDPVGIYCLPPDHPPDPFLSVLPPFYCHSCYLVVMMHSKKTEKNDHMDMAAKFRVDVWERSFGSHLHASSGMKYLYERTKKAILASAQARYETMPGHQTAFGGPWPVQSKQIKKSGAREFYAEPWPSFWRRYEKMSNTQRTYNESIRQGQPCKLYFDVDAKQVEGGPEGIRACHQRVQAFVGWVAQKLAACWPALLVESKKKGLPMLDVIWLDASSVAKKRFSVHLVFNFAGHSMFADNASLARFIDWLVDRAHEDESQATVLPKQWATDADQQWGAIIDRSVYHASKAHEMRILGSHKMGEPDRPLIPFDGVLLCPLSLADSDKESYFYRSLVGYQPAAATVALLLHCQYVSSRVDALGRSDGTGSSENSLHGIAIRHSSNSLSGPSRLAPAVSHHLANGHNGHTHDDDDAEDRMDIDDNTGGGNPTENAIGAKSRDIRPEDRNDETKKAIVPPAHKRMREATGVEDYPTHNKHLEWPMGDPLTITAEHEEAVALKLKDLLPRLEANISSRVLGYPVLRFLHWSPELGCLTFASTNKMCEIKCDMHTSNHVFYVLWLETGVFYQRCFSPGCYHRYYARLKELGFKMDRSAAGLPSNEYGRRTARGLAHVLDPGLWIEAHACVLYPRYDMDVGPIAAKRARKNSSMDVASALHKAGPSIRGLPGVEAPRRHGDEDDIDMLVRDALSSMNIRGELDSLFDD